MAFCKLMSLVTTVTTTVSLRSLLSVLILIKLVLLLLMDLSLPSAVQYVAIASILHMTCVGSSNEVRSMTYDMKFP